MVVMVKGGQTRGPPLHCGVMPHLLQLKGMKEVYPPLSLSEQSESCRAVDVPGDKSSRRQGQRKDGASSARTEGPSV